ncbi:ABC transporter permease [Hydrogenophaga crassostreae]|uniref:TRAP transporter small permease protein n=1 Tax=Hydrogenophaga crassostreae TaxID=1763535 RepID=A0A163C9M9_9BURK|nr:TRAP transporter small permease [Hydrogenophaga crassostreae]AOW12489.1 TRAP transporter small permease protein [Hydrogenophaga crassostreae]OAD40354.1 ABC transporter permease [Hydrogenophaga crassostreae]
MSHPRPAPTSVGASGVRPTQTSAKALVASFAQADHHVVDLSPYSVEDWICLGFFWTMAGLVFLQFFSRYVLNDSYAWTEELAVYCLIAIVFVGSAMCVRRARHIQVNLLYKHLSPTAGRALSTAVDIAAIVFYGYVAWLVARYAMAVNNEPMTTIDWNKSYVYWLAFAGLALMTVRGLQMALANWRRGFSSLQNPDFFDEDPN